MNTKKTGFTLVELIVVVGIIGLLSALAVVSLSRQQARSRDSRRIGDITNINTALQSYIAEKLEPPVSTNDYSNWDMSSYPTTGAAATNFMTGLSSGGYMTRVPVDPINSSVSPFWWNDPVNGFTYGYHWQTGGAGSVKNGYYVYWLGTNLELTGGPVVSDEPSTTWANRKLIFKIVPVRPVG